MPETEPLKRSQSLLRKIEWGVAILLTAFCVALHFRLMLHAGALWRDEAAAVNVAEMPSLRELWNNLHYELFPLFWFLLARIWAFIGLGSDFGFRVLGFFTGVLVIAAMWFAARCMKLKHPLFLLVLAGLSPLLIVYGDSARAWGWGSFWITLEFGLLWAALQNPSRKNVIWATAIAIAAVQTSYYNSLLLFVICCAAALVALRRTLWQRSALLIGIGAVAALTMLPYLHFFNWGEDHYSIIRENFDLRRFDQRFWEALSGWDAFSRDIVPTWIWWLLLFAAPILALVCQFLPEHKAANAQKDLVLFALIVLTLAPPVFYWFFHALRFSTSPWYYMPLILIGALGLEAIFSVCENWNIAGWIRLVVVLGIVGLVAPKTSTSIGIRMTNIEQVAVYLNRNAMKNDLILVHPFNYSISFARKYSGAAPWISVPLVDNQVHRYDILKELVLWPHRKEVIQDALDSARRVLKAGGHVWVVSEPEFDMFKLTAEPVPPPFSPKPQLKQTARVLAYWSDETGYFLQKHSKQHDQIPMPTHYGIHKFEEAQLLRYTGWRE